MQEDLAPVVLDMAAWGISDIYQLTWLTPPPKAAVVQAIETLTQLDAMENGKITMQGKKMHALPCHPRIAHMLLMAKDHEHTALATDIAPFLEERDPLQGEAGIDINDRIDALRRVRAGNGNSYKFGRIEKIASYYRKLFNIEVENCPADPYETGLFLAYAYPERIACARPGNNAQFQLSNGRLAMAGHKDDLAHEPWLAIAHLDARDGMGKIFLAAPLNPKDLAPMVKEQEVVTWDTRRGGLIAAKELRIGNILLKSTPLTNLNAEQLQRAIIEAVKKEGEHLLHFDEEVELWQNRISSLRIWNKDETWPDVSTAALLATADEWLTPYLTDVKKVEDLEMIALKTVFQYYLPNELREKSDRLAPAKIAVPTGSMISLRYFPNGEPPVLAVRLQEVFGMAETPVINHGKTAVLMHLLSPGYKPVQITSDLRSFWDNTYFEVRKELKRRYPKHEWPDDPWKAQPVRGVKRKA
jgi:ATP-dependent helicase HrpB